MRAGFRTRVSYLRRAMQSTKLTPRTLRSMSILAASGSSIMTKCDQPSLPFARSMVSLAVSARGFNLWCRVLVGHLPLQRTWGLRRASSSRIISMGVGDAIMESLSMARPVGIALEAGVLMVPMRTASRSSSVHCGLTTVS